MELYYLTAHELHDLLVKKEISAEEICRAVFDRIDAVEDKIKAYVTLTRDKAFARAREIDRKIAAGEEVPPLAGIPVAIKDNMCTCGVRTTCSSKILYNFVPPYNATVVEKLEAAGTVMMGKTNMDEFAMGSSTENSGFFVTANPWDPDRVPGGSSGGSAAAVAAGEAITALGSDTGGSIRQPAAFCGVVGLKPTYGAVSRYGLVAFASSLDQIGPFTRDVTDCALMLNAICGHDPLDSTSAPRDIPDFTSYLRNDVKGLKIGVPREYMGEGIDPAVKEIIGQAIKLLASLGAEIDETTLPHSRYALPTYYLIAPAEASSNLARYDGVRYGYRAEDARDVVDMFMKTRSQGFGPEVKRRIMLGTYALSAGYYDAYYLKALKVRTLIKQDFDRAFEKFDVLLAPTAPSPAFKRGEKTGDPLQMYMSDICTLAVNLAGIPGISIPAGFVDGLPVGMQLIGKPFGEGTLLRVAYTFEQHTDYHRRRPSL
ncbi:Asp-tRNA(Asn)/Glu-tRNA(Gln) amidotransferase subunit GatA [Desulfofundulus thermosubterraneus]|uniref:Asp-tRNA(Asn)/Glu-tRNA(Gln) amidotransferase subunit GatA n=1 Tax=Desulfofundulus thermosubterraneus TaxID=348840 RepID=UPI000932E8B8|nr:Asp-tRNA(Asn)/Glu-tRNA(Gln) amidotransferase subunit GatA [Desulfofundulus thermosubterraneus]